MQVLWKDKWTAQQWYAKVSDQHEYASGPGNDEYINRAQICSLSCLREYAVPRRVRIDGAGPGQSEQSISTVTQATSTAVRVPAALRMTFLLGRWS
jgi:hypothetical protein